MEVSERCYNTGWPRHMLGVYQRCRECRAYRKGIIAAAEEAEKVWSENHGLLHAINRVRGLLARSATPPTSRKTP